MIFISIIKNSRERKRFIRFAVVGAIGAFVDFGTFNLLSQVFHIDPVIASITSFITALTSNFIWNRYWTYPDSRTKAVSQQVFQFAVVNLIGLAIRTPIFFGFSKLFLYFINRIKIFETFSISNEVFGNNVALAVAIIVVMFWNYFANRYWTYSDVN
ncbi:MAG TPA: GtrA family protein [Anaerolineae bacterium]|nr:GtrA family protein [Anaerolineae bacterium]